MGGGGIVPLAESSTEQRKTRQRPDQTCFASLLDLSVPCSILRNAERRLAGSTGTAGTSLDACAEETYRRDTEAQKVNALRRLDWFCTLRSVASIETL